MVNIFSELKQKVEDSDGVLTIKMGDLRDEIGAQRLRGKNTEEIKTTLAKCGLAHIPLDLPTLSYKEVRLYIKKSQVGRLIEAALKVGEDNDEILRQSIAPTEPDVLKKIRRLLCD